MKDINKEFEPIYDFLKSQSNPSDDLKNILDNEMFINALLNNVERINKLDKANINKPIGYILNVILFKNIYQGHEVIKSLYNYYISEVSSSTDKTGNSYIFKHIAQKLSVNSNILVSHESSYEKKEYLLFARTLIESLTSYVRAVNSHNERISKVRNYISEYASKENLIIEELIYISNHASGIIIASIPNSEKVHVFYLNKLKHSTFYSASIKEIIKDTSDETQILTCITKIISEQSKRSFLY